MHIIIEGLDRCGKDTHIKAIKNALNDKIFHVLHYSHTKQPTNEEVIAYNKIMYGDMFELMIEASSLGRNLIFNRSHLGEAVYSPKYRNYSGDYVFEIEQKFKHYLPIWDQLALIVLVGDPEKILSRNDDNSYYTTIKDVEDEIAAFKETTDKSIIKRKIFLNTDELTLDGSISKVIEFLTTKK